MIEKKIGNKFVLRIILFILLSLLIVSLSACTESGNYAPVTEVSTIEPLPKNHIYYVRADDTLYSIAWRYGLDYRALAKMNQITHPYHIEPGQVIYLSEKHKPTATAISHSYSHSHSYSDSDSQKKVMTQDQHKTSSTFISHPEKIKTTKLEKLEKLEKVEKEPTTPVSHWLRPAKGPVVGSFSGLNKGINFGGQLGDAVVSAAAGKVVYSGDGLKAYGNLIIIKHNSIYLSAYAHNNKILVKEGDWVTRGQKIAEMGDTGSRSIMLHFEIRRSGKPVNPIKYISL